MPQDEKDILAQSFIDAEALEMIKSYHLEPDVTYLLVERQEDYYISLMGLMCQLLEDRFNPSHANHVEEIQSKLLDVVKGLLLYSDKSTKNQFTGVNQADNALYVAAIYYVCQYEAIAGLILKRMKPSDWSESATARIIYYMITARQAEGEDKELVRFLEGYVETGDNQYIADAIELIEELTRKDNYATIDDFFNAQILLAVLKKFEQHNIWRTLLEHDSSVDWHRYVVYSRSQGILSYLPSQEDAIEKGLLKYDRSFSLGMATSAGKTYITELVIYQEIQRNPDAKILYLAPLRSLSRELTERYRTIANEFGFKMRCSYGGHVNEFEDANWEEAKLLISTPEAFASTGIDYASLSLVICDEGQLLDDFGRGIEYELLLTRLREQPYLRFLFLSAIIPNLSNVNEWLGGTTDEIGVNPYRPCRQRLSAVRWNEIEGKYYADVFDEDYDDVNYSLQIGKTYEKALEHKELCVRVSLQALQAGPVMAFSSIKSWCDGLVKEMITHIETTGEVIKQPNKKVLQNIEYIAYQLGGEHRLVKSLRYGFAYHHADLPQDIRECVEKLLCSGDIELVYCTSTLAEGVNLPIKTLILCYLNNPIKPSIYVDEAKVKNIVGRVGRAGRTNYGNVVMLGGKMKWLVALALKGDIRREIKGTLYDYVHYLQLQDYKVENWLEFEELASTIDSTISKSAPEKQLDEIDIRSIVENSFAYKFSTRPEKAKLMSMFELRYEAMRAFFEHESYDIFKESGLSIGEVGRLKELLTPELMAVLEEVDTDVLTLVEKLVHLARLIKVEDYDEKKKKSILTVENIQKVAVRWVRERQYVTIAEETGLSMDEVLQIVMKMSNAYAYKVKSIVKYIQRTYEVNNEQLNMVPEFIQYGVSNAFMIYLMTKRLSNRVALYAVDDIVRKYGWIDMSSDDILLQLKANIVEISGVINQMQLPIIVKEKLQYWLVRV